jgi:tetratricopeptide (TPR) repeat protein
MDTGQLIQLAYRRYKHDDLAGSIDYYSQAIKISPNNFFAFYHRGECFYYLRDLDSAIVDFTAAIRIQPEYAETYEKRAIVYLEQHESNIAQNDFERAIFLNATRFLELGRSSLNLNDIQSALSFFNEGIRLLKIWLGLDYQWRLLVGKTNKAHATHWLAVHLFWDRAEIRQKNGDFIGAIQDYQFFYENGGWVDDGDTELVLERIRKLRAQIS